MKITKWRFLIIFWLLAIAFLVGEFWFLKWRKERLYSDEIKNEIINSMSFDARKIDNVCNIDFTNIIKGPELVRVNFFCHSGKIGGLSLFPSSLSESTFGGFISETKRLTRNDKIFDENKWTCRLNNGQRINADYKLGENTTITCNEI
jgi:hypothetical protein